MPCFKYLYISINSKFPCESDTVSHTPWTKVQVANHKEDKPECSCATGVQHCSIGRYQ